MDRTSPPDGSDGAPISLRTAPTSTALLAAVSSAFGVPATGIEPQAGGQDVAAHVYRVSSADAGPGYILKVRPRTVATDAAVRVATYLAASGVPHVVAPVAPLDGTGAPTVGRLALALYPLIEGRTAVVAGLDDAQWRMLGVFARTLHDLPVPDELVRRLPRDRYRPAELDLVARVDRAVRQQAFDDTVAHETAALWSEHRTEILDLAARTESLGADLGRRSPALAVTHGDLHTWNVLVDASGELWVIDWDELMRAPRERDLMFFVGGISTALVSPSATAAFLDGYGEWPIDPATLSYYRHAWAVQDIAGYAARILLASGEDPADRVEAAAILRSLFEPGEIADIARDGAVRP